MAGRGCLWLECLWLEATQADLRLKSQRQPLICRDLEEAAGPLSDETVNGR